MSREYLGGTPLAEEIIEHVFWNITDPATLMVYVNLSRGMQERYLTTRVGECVCRYYPEYSYDVPAIIPRFMRGPSNSADASEHDDVQADTREPSSDGGVLDIDRSSMAELSRWVITVGGLISVELSPSTSRYLGLPSQVRTYGYPDVRLNISSQLVSEHMRHVQRITRELVIAFEGDDYDSE